MDESNRRHKDERKGKRRNNHKQHKHKRKDQNPDFVKKKQKVERGEMHFLTNDKANATHIKDKETLEHEMAKLTRITENDEKAGITTVVSLCVLCDNQNNESIQPCVLQMTVKVNEETYWELKTVVIQLDSIKIDNGPSKPSLPRCVTNFLTFRNVLCIGIDPKQIAKLLDDKFALPVDSIQIIDLSKVMTGLLKDAGFESTKTSYGLTQIFDYIYSTYEPALPISLKRDPNMATSDWNCEYHERGDWTQEMKDYAEISPLGGLLVFDGQRYLARKWGQVFNPFKFFDYVPIGPHATGSKVEPKPPIRLDEKHKINAYQYFYDAAPPFNDDKEQDGAAIEHSMVDKKCN